MKKTVYLLVIAAVVLIGIYAFREYKLNALNRIPGLASGNGRLEATEVNISAKLAGRIDSVLASEGDMVKKGQPLVQMQTNTLNAELAQAQARKNQAAASEVSAKANVLVRKGELEAAKAVVLQRKTSCETKRRHFERQKTLMKTGATTQQLYEDSENKYLESKAELAAAEASVKQAEAAVSAADAEAQGAKANIAAADADIRRIQADIDDSTLTAPLGGRIQYRISEPGEVLNAGGKVLNLVDLTDVYMTFFLPEGVAGKVPIGADTRILLDALPGIPIPAKVSFVASVAQFTPKTVETKVERQKLMFRVKAKIEPELLKKYIEYVKTGIPGVAWVKIDPKTEWPEELQVKNGK